MSRHQKGETSLDFTEARDSEWQWQQLGHMQVCTTDRHNYIPSAIPFAAFYLRDAMLARAGTSYGSASVCPSVTSRCSIETAERIQLVYGIWELPLSAIRKFRYLKKLGYFPLELCSKLWT